MSNSDGLPEDSSVVESKRKVIVAGSMLVLTGVVAGTLLLTLPSPAQACPDPPCPKGKKKG
jgi:hypothetical protein